MQSSAPGRVASLLPTIIGCEPWAATTGARSAHDEGLKYISKLSPESEKLEPSRTPPEAKNDLTGTTFAISELSVRYSTLNGAY